MSTEAMRQKFEEFIITRTAFSIKRNSEGSYVEVEVHWMVWQAASANQEALIKTTLDAAAEICELAQFTTPDDEGNIALREINKAIVKDCQNTAKELALYIRQINTQHVMEMFKNNVK